jgi:glycosyltransferase involved in cell wall biosynthesis
MKILQVIGSISPARGGPSTAIRTLVKALRTQGIETDIATTDDDGDGQRKYIPDSKHTSPHSGRIFCFRKQTEFYSTSVPMLQWLLKHSEHYDLLHIHGLFNFAPTVGAHSAKRSHIPYILTPHGTLNRWGLKNRRPLLKKLSMQLVESRIVRGAKLIHFTSDVEQGEAGDLKFPTAKTIIPIGQEAATSADPAIPPGMDQLSHDSQSQQKILFLSRIDRIKNLDVLLFAMQHVIKTAPGALLLIAGDGSQALVSELKALGKTLGIERNLIWLGFVSGPHKAWLLQNCAILAMPSQSENFGLSAVEAMAYAMPVVVAPGVGLAPMVKRYGAGSVCAPNPPELASTLLSLLVDPKRRKQAGLAAKMLVQDELSIETFGLRLRQMYEQTIATTESQA